MKVFVQETEKCPKFNTSERNLDSNSRDFEAI